MSVARFACRCDYIAPILGGDCPARATQEDMLCDECRRSDICSDPRARANTVAMGGRHMQEMNGHGFIRTERYDGAPPVDTNGERTQADLDRFTFSDHPDLRAMDDLGDDHR